MVNSYDRNKMETIIHGEVHACGKTMATHKCGFTSAMKTRQTPLDSSHDDSKNQSKTA